MRRIERMVGRRDPATLTARDLMQDQLVTCGPGTSAATVAVRLCDGNFGSIPIVDEQRALLGLVSEFDLLKSIQEGKNLRRLHVEDVMTRALHTVAEGTAFPELIEQMLTRHLIRLPVMRGETLIGVVARRDILYGYLLASFQQEGAEEAKEKW